MLYMAAVEKYHCLVFFLIVSVVATELETGWWLGPRSAWGAATAEACEEQASSVGARGRGRWVVGLGP